MSGAHPSTLFFPLHLHLKNFSKIFLGHSSLGGGPLSRSNVKFRGWTAGSAQCQITRRG
ncbi:ORF48 [White spot syndrome virus]|uniref:ORF48 n=1 Tax=White spot syndrome virus TaxID=342409 RepID=A0A0X9MHY6_9VIRU|nr:ORF48 [White spot syndrome virus]ALZ45707.1 hypothetical protein [White spot syndrome virus]ASV62958.1 hypothetical protein [White spot syndrome virus]AYW76507.1 hypothetical protein [Procambarus clarkii virus]